MSAICSQQTLFNYLAAYGDVQQTFGEHEPQDLSSLSQLSPSFLSLKNIQPSAANKIFLLTHAAAADFVINESSQKNT